MSEPTTENPYVIKHQGEDYVEVRWFSDELELKQGTQPRNQERILMRITKLKKNVVEKIMCVPREPRDDDQTRMEYQLGPPIKYSPRDGIVLTATLYLLSYKADCNKKMIKIWLDGVECALDVFGDLQKQVMNFAEVGGMIVQIDVGEKNQSIGECLNYSGRKKDKIQIPIQCRQQNVFLWEGDTYTCFQKDRTHCKKNDSFCRRCVQIIEGTILSCPTHSKNGDTFNRSVQDGDKNTKFTPVKDN